MKILITGGAGFIGRYLSKYLLERNHQVTILDNFSNSKKENLNHILKFKPKIIDGDINTMEDIERSIKNQEIVIHLAAKISVLESIKNPRETFRTNVEGTKKVITTAQKNKIKKIIIASSAAIYGNINGGKKLTETSKIYPISPYGDSKSQMEKFIISRLHNSELKFDILRFFNIFGEGQTSEYSGVITKFIENINKNQSIKINGDGLQTRDFIFIDDVIQSIDHSIQKINKKSNIYNIASGKSITIKKLAEELIKFSKKTIDIKFELEQKGEIKYSKASIELAKNELNFKPKYGLNNLKHYF